MRYFVFIGFLAFCGCASLTGVPERHHDVKAELESLSSYFEPSVLTTYEGKAGNEKREYRNQVIFARIRATDLYFNEFIKAVSSENKKLNIGTDGSVLLLGAAGAVTTVSTAQSILAGASATIVGMKASIDKNAYYEKTISALVSQMKANRKEVLVELYAGMTKEVEEYPLMRAFVDLENYFQAGTILSAVNEVHKEAGDKEKVADQDLKTIVKSGFQKDVSGDKLRSFWKPDGKNKDPKNEALILDWIAKQIGDKVSITYFMRSETFASARKKLVEELKLK